ncbi:FtsX-like permease family protein [Mycoplasma sp. P36-A1]|uniref:FtsX-like permease family protein n=1 Tax=Mycoplasma sp. P36-A1 TaxID=3252900 RepID=UPI003C2CAAB6
MKNAYNKSIFREIKNSLGRFLSIMTIILLGVAIYVGIKSTGPDIKNAVINYYTKYNLMDAKIVSDYGLNDNDLKILKNDDLISEYVATHSLDINLTNQNSVVRILEYNNNSKINKIEVVEGRLPEKANEIALDSEAFIKNENLKIGSEYIIESEKDVVSKIKNTKLKIVGKVDSPLFMDNLSRGTTTVGNGSIDYFAYMNKSNFKMDVYTEIYVKFNNINGIKEYSPEYKKIMNSNNDYLLEIFSNRAKERTNEIKKEALKEFEKPEKKIEDAQIKIDNALDEINKAKAQLNEGKLEYEQGVTDFYKKVDNAQIELNNSKNTLDSNQSILDKNKKELDSSLEKLKQAKKQLDSALKEFKNKNINPKEIKTYEENYKLITQLNNQYNQLLIEVNSYTETISTTNPISNDVLLKWKTIIDTPEMNLISLSPIIEGLLLQPTNKTLLDQLSSSLEQVISITKNNQDDLDKLIKAINKYNTGLKEYNQNNSLLIKNKNKLLKAQKTIDSGYSQVKAGQKELNDLKIAGEKQLQQSKQTIDQNETTIASSEQEIANNQDKLDENKNKIEVEKNKVNEIEKAKYYFSDRTDNPGYSTIGDSVASLDTIAIVFPVFFFLVAVLICLSTMTRMVEEKRSEIGTLKALGYSNLMVAKKFIVYSIIASLAGALLGVAIGSSLLPKIISNSYSMLFKIPSLELIVYPSFTMQAIIISIISTVGAAMFVLGYELRETPANLMRPKAPKLGKKIFLEKIPAIWSRLNFNYKVTFRNLFRYKQRMIMTILGIGGCTALLIVAFALQNSNKYTLVRQFDDVWKYQAIVVTNSDLSEKEQTVLNDKIKKEPGFENMISTFQENVKLYDKDDNKLNVTLLASQNNDLSQYIRLQERVAKKQLNLNDNKAIVTEKIADIYKLKTGDHLNFSDTDGNKYSIEIGGITENYIGNYIYINANYYKTIMNKKLVPNSRLIKLTSTTNQSKFSDSLMKNDHILNVSTMNKISETSRSTTGSLDTIVIVIIIASGALAFVVLYNLNTINVAERIRELSTIKVLGFFDNEVTMYILRENIILTILGIIFGMGLGNILYQFLITTAISNAGVMMIPDVSISSYALAAIVTFIFSSIVMVIVHRKLIKIDMIDALKSNE